MNPQKRETPLFDPNKPAYRRKLWVRLRTRHGHFRYFFWRRILVVFAVAAVIGWLAVTAAVWANLRLRRKFTEVRYADLVAPWRWPRYITAMSGHYAAMGNAALSHGAPDSAFYYFNAALALRPHNAETQRMAALAQYRMGLKPAALSTLTDGVQAAARAGDEAYLRQYFGMAFDTQSDDEAYRVGRALLPASPDANRIHQLIAFQLATARFNRGHYDEAERLLTDWNLRSAPEGLVLYSDCQWESGQHEPALLTLREGLDRFPRQDGIYAALERIARTQHQPEAELHYALLRQIGDPAHFPPQLDLLYADQAAGRFESEMQALDLYCRTFKSDPDALSQLLQFAIDTGQPAVAERAAALAEAAGQPAAGYDLGIAEAGLAAGDFAGVGRALGRLKAGLAQDGRSFQVTVAGIEGVARFGARDPDAELVFDHFLAEAPALRPPEALLLAKCLKAENQPKARRELLERAYSGNFESEPLLIELERAELETGKRGRVMEQVAALLKVRKVPRELLAGVWQRLDQPEDAALRGQIAELIKLSPATPLAVRH